VIASVTGQAAVIDAIPVMTQDMYRLVADISKLKELGYEPQMGIEDGVAQRFAVRRRAELCCLDRPLRMA